MKQILISCCLLTAAAGMQMAHADVCAYMPCGTYVHAADANDANSVETSITIASTGADTGTFDYTMKSQDGKSSTWPLTVKFSADGAAELRWQGQDLYATAICKYQMCNYALIPFQDDKSGIWGNAGLMRFTGDTLEFMMTVGQPTDYKSRGMVMAKKN